jgi:hypothetical protein
MATSSEHHKKRIESYKASWAHLCQSAKGNALWEMSCTRLHSVSQLPRLYNPHPHPASPPYMAHNFLTLGGLFSPGVTSPRIPSFSPLCVKAGFASTSCGKWGLPFAPFCFCSQHLSCQLGLLHSIPRLGNFNNGNLFLTNLETIMSKVKVSMTLARVLFLICKWPLLCCILTLWKEWSISLEFLFIRALNPFMKVLPLWSNGLLKSPYCNLQIPALWR